MAGRYDWGMSGRPVTLIAVDLLAAEMFAAEVGCKRFDLFSDEGRKRHTLVADKGPPVYFGDGDWAEPVKCSRCGAKGLR